MANRGAVEKVEEIESTTHFSLEFIYSVYVIEGFDFAYTVKRQAVFIISFLMEKPPQWAFSWHSNRRNRLYDIYFCD